MKTTLKLYWTMTDDHDEDWFMIAKSKRNACRLHEDMEGYNKGDADAELIMRLPPEKQDVPEGGPMTN